MISHHDSNMTGTEPYGPGLGNHGYLRLIPLWPDNGEPHCKKACMASKLSCSKGSVMVKYGRLSVEHDLESNYLALPH